MIKEAILNKPKSAGRLTSEEFKEMQNHTSDGVTILNNNFSDLLSNDQLFYRYCIEICQSHHERWDGKGYPYGLAGDRIPLGARIIAIADVYQALVSNRPYRKAYSRKKAIQIIKEAAGTQFDSDVVDVFSAVLESEQ